MEILYFPLFLVVVAVGVVWLFKKATNGSTRDRRSSSRNSGRFTDPERWSGSHNRPGAAARLQSGQGRSNPRDIWQTKRERAAKESFGHAASSGVYAAGYIGPDSRPGVRRSGATELRDQEVSEAEHRGIDEYLTKSEREAARREAERAAEEAGGLSMAAMKYDPSADADLGGEDEQKRKRSAGFKP